MRKTTTSYALRRADGLYFSRQPDGVKISWTPDLRQARTWEDKDEADVLADEGETVVCLVTFVVEGDPCAICSIEPCLAGLRVCSSCRLPVFSSLPPRVTIDAWLVQRFHEQQVERGAGSVALRDVVCIQYKGIWMTPGTAMRLMKFDGVTREARRQACCQAERRTLGELIDATRR